MIDAASKHVGNRLDSAMGMQREAGPIIGGIGTGKMVQQQKRIEIVQTPSADASLEPDPGAFDERFRLNHGCYFSLRCRHALLLMRQETTPRDSATDASHMTPS